MVERMISGVRVLLDDRDAHFFNAGMAIGHATYSRFVRVTHSGKSKRLARVLMGEPEGLVVDHINGNPFDNRRSNLRVCTVQQNNWNRKRRVAGDSKFKGVSRKGSKWSAAIWPHGQQKYLGSFETAEEAARAYDRAAAAEYGEFACLNFPAERAARSAVLLSHPAGVPHQ